MLTKGGWSGILTKLSARSEPQERESGKDGGHIERLKSKTPEKKFLTKRKRYGKLKKLLMIRNGPGVKKLLKKVLDKRNEV